MLNNSLLVKSVYFFLTSTKRIVPFSNAFVTALIPTSRRSLLDKFLFLIGTLIFLFPFAFFFLDEGRLLMIFGSSLKISENNDNLVKYLSRMLRDVSSGINKHYWNKTKKFNAPDSTMDGCC